ncbi:DNA repair protein RadA [Caldithrix abyssi DSM 13497]|nr:DNA repair protein RadA [Caldithrix abyssi]EHO42593.1 DNA repair protein RadA [Caldithrix abyssi DSM 13497]
MARKNKPYYVCSACGYRSEGWLGRCPQCDSWNTMEEFFPAAQNKTRGPAAELLPLMTAEVAPEHRLSTGISELDHVLGGGNVLGSVTLVGGDPGIGKSTLLLQMLDSYKSQKKKLFISGEESLHQIQNRAQRLKISGQNVYYSNVTNLEQIEQALRHELPGVAVIDSIQTILSEKIDGLPGNISQLRYTTAHLVRLAKELNISLFIIGHVTKEGSLAGPKVLEHLVDTVLYFEGDNKADFRILRSVKNRYGPVNEIALFRMESYGLMAVDNPSELFLNLDVEDRMGTAVVAIMEGNRPVLIEVQALVSKTQFGVPQRTAMGIDHRRMNLLLAVLEKKCGKPFSFYDVFIKTAGGIRVTDPAADLGICMALVSSMDENPLPREAVYIGEVGLNAELRPVNQIVERIREADKLGFRRVVAPDSKQKIHLNVQCKVERRRKLQDLIE